MNILKMDRSPLPTGSTPKLTYPPLKIKLQVKPYFGQGANSALEDVDSRMI